ncbi:MAG TPA: MFS transporter, partial [Polyangiaceae bacterium]|nr:MFS transporter [Polyangiaceae bacterium]
MSGWTIMAIAWIGVIGWISFVIFANRKTHPKALFLLFFAEFWERFSYYGMRALLILYMTSSMGYSDDDAYGIYAAYGAMVYATPIVGGLIAEKLMGYRKAIFWGGTLMALGHFAMAFEYEIIFYLALALLILGNGFFKPNISSFIATFYEKNDPRKDGAYTIFYMGINAGAMLTPLTCGYIGEQVGWHYGFGLAGVGMVLGLVVFVIARAKGYFEDNGHPSEPEKLAAKTAGMSREILIYVL